MEADDGTKNTALRLYATYDDEVARCIRESGQPDDFVTTRYLDDRPMPTLQPEEQQRGYLVFQRHWMNLVFPNSIPQREEVTNTLESFAAPGEYEPLTFCIRTLREIRNLEVKVEDLVSPNGDRMEVPTVQLVRCVPRTWQGEQWLYKDGPVGVMAMPAYLEIPRLIDIVAGRTVQFWLTVKVDDDAAAGIYQSEIHIRHDQGKTCTITLQVEVLPVRLLTPPHVLGFWDFQRAYQGEIGNLDQVHQVMREHGVNAVFARVGLFEYDKKTDAYDFSKYISIDDSGHVTVVLDGSSLEASMVTAKKTGLQHFIYTPTLSLFVAREVFARYGKPILEQQMATEISKVTKRFQGSQQYEVIKKEIINASQKYYPMYSQAYADLYVKIVREICKEVQKRQWPRLVLSSMDEAYSHHVHQRTAYPFVVRHLELMKQAGATTILNHCSPFLGGVYSEYMREAMKHLDIAMPGGRLSLERGRTSPYNATLDQLVEAFAQEGITTYNYSLSGQAGGVFPDLSVVRFSGGFFFHTLGKGVLGNIDYIYFRPEGDPYNPIDDYNATDNRQLWSHERLWFFPPQESTGRLVGRSLSLVAKREGFDDLRYLETLNALIEQTKSKSDSPRVQQSTQSATLARQRILASFHFTDKALDDNRRNSWSRWDTARGAKGEKSTVAGELRLANGWTYSKYDHSRREIADAITQLQKLLPAEEVHR